MRRCVTREIELSLVELVSTCSLGLSPISTKAVRSERAMARREVTTAPRFESESTLSVRSPG